MAKIVQVEFRYFDRNTCSRCRATDKNVEKTLQDLRGALGEAGIEFRLKTTKLPASRMSESNSILINGKDIEALLSKNKGSRFTSCRGCGALINGPCDCRAYSYCGKKYRHVPKAMIREAIRKALAIGNRTLG